MHKIRQVILIFFNSEEDGLFMFGRGGKGEVLWNHQGQVYSIHEYKCQCCLTASPRSGGGMNEWAEYVHSRNEHICECAYIYLCMILTSLLTPPSTLLKRSYHRRRIYTEEKAKVAAAVWGACRIDSIPCRR